MPNLGEDPETLFTIGLLRDIGKLLLDTKLPEEMAKILQIGQERNLSFWDAEKLVFATDHFLLGAWLMRQWNLPESIIDGVKDHRVPREKRRQFYVMTQFTRYLCALRGVPEPADFSKPVLTKEIWETLKIDRQIFPGLLAELNKEVSMADELLAAVKRVA